MTFHVGQKVVCINKMSWKLNHGPAVHPPSDIGNFPRYLGVYEISSMATHSGFTWLTLRECDPRCEFPTIYFRPIVERETNISIFKEILNSASRGREPGRGVEPVKHNSGARLPIGR